MGVAYLDTVKDLLIKRFEKDNIKLTAHAALIGGLISALEQQILIKDSGDKNHVCEKSTCKKRGEFFSHIVANFVVEKNESKLEKMREELIGDVECVPQDGVPSEVGQLLSEYGVAYVDLLFDVGIIDEIRADWCEIALRHIIQDYLKHH